MNDFKSFSNAKNTPSGGTNANQSGQNSQNNAQLDNTVEMAKIIAKAMNGKSTAQIMQTIIAEAERGKRAGTLTNADLDNFYNAISPILDSSKKRKLKQIITNLKNI